MSVSSVDRNHRGKHEKKTSTLQFFSSFHSHTTHTIAANTWQKKHGTHTNLRLLSLKIDRSKRQNVNLEKEAFTLMAASTSFEPDMPERESDFELSKIRSRTTRGGRRKSENSEKGSCAGKSAQWSHLHL